MTTAPRVEPDVSLRKDAPPFERILIANRGEIALRIIRTCRDLGVQTVAVYSDADRHAAHVEAADVAVRIGPAPAAESYLRPDAIIDAALSTGARAIHPGYGFLSERAMFARQVADAGVVFIGPSVRALESLGDKLAARRSADAAGVAVVPGTWEPARFGDDAETDHSLADAERVGYPLLVKATAGGGGRGMRRVVSAHELPAALAAGSAEALAAFGDGSVYLEREVRPARHIEVQLLGDDHGSLVALGERDCSVQRRHQKLVEEAPAPGLTPTERADLHAMAVRAATAAELSNAATAEFLFDRDRRFWFLEVNARLQVEHGVTELVTGLDLVAEQLWIAAGQPLSAAVLAVASEASAPRRHAIEVRLSAEDPAREFAASPGTVGRWVMPGGPGVRVDTALRPGDRIPPDYDPMVAKIMTVGEDRDGALARMRRALDEVEVTGVQTTLPFHRVLLGDPAFVDVIDLSTDRVASQWDGEAARSHAFEAAAVAAADAAARAGQAAPPDAAGQRPAAATPSLRKDGSAGGWRAAGRAAVTGRWPR